MPLSPAADAMATAASVLLPQILAIGAVLLWRRSHWASRHDPAADRQPGERA